MLVHAQTSEEHFFEQPKRMRAKERTSQKRQKCAEALGEYIQLTARNTTLNGQLAEYALDLAFDELAGDGALQGATAQELDAFYERIAKRNKEIEQDNRKKHDDIRMFQDMKKKEKAH